MKLPVATWKTALIAGLSLTILCGILAILKARSFIRYDADDGQVFPFIAIYFVATVLLFVTDVRTFAPKELKTNIPFVYFPTNWNGVRFILSVWGRMIVWFLGVVVGIELLAPLAHWHR